MKLEILKPIVGTGAFVQGFSRQFALDAGMTVEVEDAIAAKWIASGIARAADGEKPAPDRTPEIEMLATPPETTALRRPKAKPRKNPR